MAAYPAFIGVGAGSIAGLGFNFSASKWVVFRAHKEPLGLTVSLYPASTANRRRGEVPVTGGIRSPHVKISGLQVAA